MKSMSLREIAAACGGTYFGPESNLGIEVSGVAIDSRKIEDGYLFIPIKGARVDGHDFIPAVMEKALCTLSEKDLRYYHNNGDFKADAGQFEIFVGGSSSTLHKLQFQYNEE